MLVQGTISTTDAFATVLFICAGGLIGVPTLMVLFLMVPDILIGENSFRIAASPFYVSKPIGWAAIKWIRKPILSRFSPFHSRKKILGISISGISPFFRLVGLVYFLSKEPTFIIHQEISDFEELVDLFRARRPDLLESQ
jgi:hypothetical protein